jgi:hypothetical protein
MSLTNKVKTFINKLNERGIPMPLLRDPKNNGPSVSLTIMVIAFAIASAGLIGKFTKLIGEVDVSGALYLYLTSAGLYYGRKLSGDSTKKTIEMEEDKENK